MPLPLKPGYNFYIDRKCKPSDYEMSQLEIYRDYYGMSYTVSGNRKFIMPNMIAFLHGGSIGITMKDVYHKTSPNTCDTSFSNSRFVLSSRNILPLKHNLKSSDAQKNP